MRRVFYDANLLFAAAYSPKGKAADVVEATKGKPVGALLTCQQAVEEARRNLGQKAPKALGQFEKLLESFELHPTVYGLACELDLPAADARIYHSAIAARASDLLTGDLRHFGPFMNKPQLCRGLRIQTVAEYHLGLKNGSQAPGDIVAERKTRYGQKMRLKGKPARYAKR